ncbi:MAG: pre-peptidase C-terminal domain-containing protein [Cyanobacteria bacterium P01_G01_bin.19]
MEPIFVPETAEPNDIIELAQVVDLSDATPQIGINGSIEFDENNQYDLDDTVIGVDGSEDVDLYQVDLAAGDTIFLDADANQFGDGRKVDPWLRLFDANGVEVASNDDGAAPNEIFDSGFEPYIEFTAPEAGTYYAGISIYENSEYDPFTPGSGNGFATQLDPNEYGTGEYTLNFNLNQPEAFIPEATEIPPSTGEGIPLSLVSVSGVYNSDFENENFEVLLSNGVVETAAENTGSALNIILATEGEVPEGGIEVYINTDVALPDYFGDLEDEEFGQDYAVPYGGNIGTKPFTRGGQFLDAVYNEDGEATGFKFLLEESYGVITLNPSNRAEAETDGPETVTFSLVESEGYIATPVNSSTVTFYDTLEQAPVPEVTPEVSLELSTNELIESEGTELTLNLSLDQAPPATGVQVYISGGEFGFLGELDVFAADIQGGIPIPDGDTTGVYFQMLEQTASITLPVFDSAAIEEPEGIEQFDVTVLPGAGYTVNPEQNGGSLTIKDTPDSLPQVSLTTEPEVLIESEATVANVNLSLSAPPPEEGVTVTISAPEMIEFNPDTLEATGGELVSATPDNTSFTFNLTEQDATVSVAVADDGEAEGIETATFTVEPGEGYQVDTEANSGTFTIADTSEIAPGSTEEVNDTIDTAIATGIAEINPTVSFSGEINEYYVEDEEGNASFVDFSEDVDLYSFNLNAGDTIAVDVDSIELDIEGFAVPQSLDSELRVFDAAGNELQLVTEAPAPDESGTNGDPYLEFTAIEDGTYYVGIAQLDNNYYDPNQAGSGSGSVFPESGINVGEYEINFTLNPEPESTFKPVFGSIDGDTIEVEGSNQLIFAGDLNDLVDASTGNGGNRIYAGSGDDTLVLGESDRILAGEGDDAIFATSGGDNTITGGAGADQFWIASAEIPDTSSTIEITADTGFFTFGENVSESSDRRLLSDKATVIGFAGLETISFLEFELGEISQSIVTNAELILEHDADLAETLIPATADRPVSVSAYEVTAPLDEVNGNLDDINYGEEGANGIATTVVGEDGIYSWDVTELIQDELLNSNPGANVALSGVFGNENIDDRNSYASFYPVGTTDGLEPTLVIETSAVNLITDFTAGEDVIGIAGLGIGFEDVSIIDIEGDALITAAGSDLAILQGIAADSLSESDFVFA